MNLCGDPNTRYSRSNTQCDDLTADQWLSLSAAERREIELIGRERSLLEPFELHHQRIDAQADPATMAALDALLAGQTGHVPTIRIQVRTEAWDTPPSCPNKIARTGTTVVGDEWVTDIIELDCERRSCPVCGPIWVQNKAMNVHANFADEAAISLIEVADIEWDATRKAMQRCDQDAMYVRIPAAENDRWLLLTTAAIGKGRSVEAREAISAAEQALTGVSHRASVDRRAVSTSRNFVNYHQVRATTADPEVVWGQLTRIDTSNMHESLSKLAERTGVDFVCVTRDEDDDLVDTTRWRLRGDPMSMRLALAAGGHRTDAELAEDREAKKHADEFDDFLREQKRRPIHNVSIGRPREMSAA